MSASVVVAASREAVLAWLEYTLVRSPAIPEAPGPAVSWWRMGTGPRFNFAVTPEDELAPYEGLLTDADGARSRILLTVLPVGPNQVELVADVVGGTTGATTVVDAVLRLAAKRWSASAAAANDGKRGRRRRSASFYTDQQVQSMVAKARELLQKKGYGPGAPLARAVEAPNWRSLRRWMSWDGT